MFYTPFPLCVSQAAGREGSQEDKAELKTLTENHLRRVAQKHHFSFTPNTSIVLTVNVNAETLVGENREWRTQPRCRRPLVGRTAEASLSVQSAWLQLLLHFHTAQCTLVSSYSCP